MLWLGTAVMLVAGIVALLVLSLKHPGNPPEHGSVSDRWIAEHRVDFP
jgi:hypothetical protein